MKPYMLRGDTARSRSPFKVKGLIYRSNEVLVFEIHVVIPYSRYIDLLIS